MTSAIYRDLGGTGTVKFGTAVYREYREYDRRQRRGFRAVVGRLSDGVLDYPFVTSDVGLSMVGAKFRWSTVAPIALVIIII